MSDKYLDLPNAELIGRIERNITRHRAASREAHSIRDYREVRHIGQLLTDAKADLEILNARTW